MSKSTNKSAKDIEIMLGELIEATVLAVELFNNDYDKANDWMLTDNSYFFGTSPVGVVFSKNGSYLLKYLKDKLGK